MDKKLPFFFKEREFFYILESDQLIIYIEKDDLFIDQIYIEMINNLSKLYDY